MTLEFTRLFLRHGLLNEMKIPSLPKIKISNGQGFGRYLRLAGPALAILMSLAVLVFVVWPRFNDVLKLRKVNEELAERVEKLETKAQKLAEFDKDELESQLGYTNAMIPSGKEVFLLVAQVELSATSSGVVLSKVEVSPGTVGEVGKGQGQAAIGAAPLPTAATNLNQTPADQAAGPTPKVQVKVSLSSDYKSFVQFLNNVLSFSRVVDVRDLSLTSVIGVGQTTGQLRTLVTLDAYYKPLPQELASVETPISELTQSEIERIERVKKSGISGPQTLPPVEGGRSDLFAPF